MRAARPRLLRSDGRRCTVAATGRNTPQRHQLRGGVQASAGGKGLKSTRGAYAGLAETFRNLKQYNGMRRRWARTGLAPRARPTGQGNLPARRPWTCIRESSFRTATDWFPSRRLKAASRRPWRRNVQSDQDELQRPPETWAVMRPRRGRASRLPGASFDADVDPDPEKGFL